MAVYLIRAGETGPVKIGYASTIDRRVAMLQAAHWERLCVLRRMAGDRTTEAWFHQWFAARRIDRDWFHFHPDMLTIDPAPEAISTATDNPIAQIAALFGGQSALGRALGRKQSTIWEWVNAGSIPAWQIRPIIKAATELSPPVELRPEHFFGATPIPIPHNEAA